MQILQLIALNGEHKIHLFGCGVFFFVFFFLGPNLWHMEVPRLGVKSELQLLAYTTATAKQDSSHICNVVAMTDP